MKHPPYDPRQRLDDWVGEHGGAIRGYIWAMTRRADVADDLTQEVFRRAAAAQGKYQETGHARAWLLRIADRLVTDRARKAGREVNIDQTAWTQVEPTARDDDPTATLDQQETEQQLAAALQRLSAPQRRVLLLRYYGNMEFAEIARTMECPLNTALSHCRRGLLILRKLLVEQAT